MKLVIQLTLFVGALASTAFGISEYTDYSIKQSLAQELVIEPEHITFLYGSNDVCEEDQTLWDKELGICINNIAFGQYTDTDVGL